MIALMRLLGMFLVQLARALQLGTILVVSVYCGTRHMRRA